LYKDTDKTDVEDKSFTNVKSNDVTQMKAALEKNPLAVSIQANKEVF